MPFDPEGDPTAAPHAMQTPEWAGLGAGRAAVPFAAPAWEGFAPSEPPPAATPSSDGVQEQIAALLQDAEQEALRLKEEAYAAGYAAGERQGLAAGEQRVQALVERLGQTLQEVGRLRARLFEQSEGEMLELVLAIARKVLHDEGSFHRDSILALIRAGIRRATQRQELHIKVHPADLLFTTSCKAQLLSYVDGVETIRFQEDAEVPPGSCIVETPTEVIDLRWDEQLEEIAAALFETYECARRGEVA